MIKTTVHEHLSDHQIKRYQRNKVQ